MRDFCIALGLVSVFFLWAMEPWWHLFSPKPGGRTFSIAAEPSVGGYQGQADPCQQNISVARMLMVERRQGAEKMECWWTRDTLFFQIRKSAALFVGVWDPTPIHHQLGDWWVDVANFFDVAVSPWRQDLGADWVLAVPTAVLPRGIDFAVQPIGLNGAGTAVNLRSQ